MNKRLLLLAMLACLLSACEQATQPNEQQTTPAIVDTNKANLRNDIPRAKKPSIHKPPNKASAKEAEIGTPSYKPLDLNIRKGDLVLDSTPTVNTPPVLPNLFEAKKPEKKRLSVGGKLLLDDQPDVELRQSIQGAQMSIQVSTP